MKIALTLLAALTLAGCSSLNVSWHLTASYNTKVQAATMTEHGLGEEKATVPPALPGKAL